MTASRYDGQGRRIERDVHDAAGTLEITFPYHYAPDAYQLIEERNVSGGDAVLRPYTCGAR